MSGKLRTTLFSALCLGMVVSLTTPSFAESALSTKALRGGPLKPTARILVAPLGFQPPSRFYMPYRFPAATLDFLDATHILFTFHASTLMRREPDDPAGDEDQTVRALVLSVPDGKVVAQSSWRLHDRARYLWFLGEGEFLLRVRNTLMVGDRSLVLKKYLAAEGDLVSVQLSPAGRTIAAQYAVPAPENAQGDGRPANAPTLGDDAPHLSATPQKRYELVVIDAASQKGQRISDLGRAVDLPMLDQGYLSVHQEDARMWDVVLAPFAGEARTVEKVNSTCQPLLYPLSEHTFLTENCMPATDDRLVQAFDLDGHKLWEKIWQSRFTWGTFAYGSEGRRFAYGSVEVDHSLSTLDPIDASSILGQPVGVFDIANGELTTVLDASPILTAGENFSLSPDGNTLAILRDGAIEFYTLPPAPPAPK